MKPASCRPDLFHLCRDRKYPSRLHLHTPSPLKSRNSTLCRKSITMELVIVDSRVCMSSITTATFPLSGKKLMFRNLVREGGTINLNNDHTYLLQVHYGVRRETVVVVSQKTDMVLRHSTLPSKLRRYPAYRYCWICLLSFSILLGLKTPTIMSSSVRS